MVPSPNWSELDPRQKALVIFFFFFFFINAFALGQVLTGSAKASFFFFSFQSKTTDKQSILNSSNTDSSFTIANSNPILSPYGVLPIAQENKYLGKFSYLVMKSYVVCTH